MQKRKDPLEIGEFYHIYSRSIAGYRIFNDESDFDRMYELFKLYRYSNFDFKYSRFCNLSIEDQANIERNLVNENNILIEIVAYCIMPTHIHLLLKQEMDCGISKFMARVLNGYSRYFNTKHLRAGPLWAGRFKNVLVKSDEQLLHLSRYIHLNPTSAGLVKEPEDWQFSSYGEYLGDPSNGLCNFKNLFEMFSAEDYKKFVSDRKTYQREISIIKNLLIEDYTG